MTWLYLSIYQLLIYLSLLYASPHIGNDGGRSRVKGDRWLAKRGASGCLRDAQSTGDAPALLMGHSLRSPTAVLCQEGVGKGAAETTVEPAGPQNQGKGLGQLPLALWAGERGCWPIPRASSRLCEELLPKWRSFETAQEVGEETFREEINKRGDRLLTLAKGALAYLWNFTPLLFPWLKIYQASPPSQRWLIVLKP